LRGDDVLSSIFIKVSYRDIANVAGSSLSSEGLHNRKIAHAISECDDHQIVSMGNG
jgi:hypothetical protein